MYISAVYSKIVISGVDFYHNTEILYRAKGGAVLAIKTEITNIVIIQNSTFIGNNNGGLLLY